MASRSPTVRQRRLALELRRLRETTGLTMERVAETLRCSVSKISRIETARIGVSQRDLGDLLKLYGLAGEQRDALVLLAQAARQKDWWQQAYRDLPVTALIGLESEAASLREYSVALVPGLLQTRDYASAVLTGIRVDLNTREIVRRVEVRMARQAILTKENAPVVWVVVDEAVLRRRIGGREVMLRQLDHLGQTAALPNVTLQVLPFTVGEHAGLDGAFVILGFSQPGDPDVVYLENRTSDLYLETSDAVRVYSVAFDYLRAAALSPSESAAFLARLARSM